MRLGSRFQSFEGGGGGGGESCGRAFGGHTDRVVMLGGGVQEILRGATFWQGGGRGGFPLNETLNVLAF